MISILADTDNEDLRKHCSGEKDLKIFVNGEEIDFLKISTNNVAIEAQIKWVTEAVSKANTKERQLTRLHTTKDMHSKVKTDAARTELCAIKKS